MDRGGYARHNGLGENQDRSKGDEKKRVRNLVFTCVGLNWESVRVKGILLILREGKQIKDH